MLKSNRKVYMDYASATPIDLSVLQKMNKILKENYANASSLHDLGRESKKILDQSRKDVADILGARADEIIFTSGATESNNLAILGMLENMSRTVLDTKMSKTVFDMKIPHIVTTNIEHPSVLEVYKYLEKTGKAQVTYVGVEKNGIVDPQKIKKAIRGNTVLVSVMYANNEIGTIQPIKEIAKEIRHFKKTRDLVKFSRVLGLGPDQLKNFLSLSFPFFHTDATQAINYLPINVEKLGVDLMSFNAGKIYGPKGVGALYVKRNTPVDALQLGGGQEFGIRSGTENLAGIVGLTEALKLTEKIKEKEIKRLSQLHRYFIEKLSNSIEGLKVNGDIENRLPNNINITIPKIPSDLLVIELSVKGIFVSEKSACQSGDRAGSHVLNAINNPKLCKRNKENSSIRFSLGRQTKKEDIDCVITTLTQILKKLKKWYN